MAFDARALVAEDLAVAGAHGCQPRVGEVDALAAGVDSVRADGLVVHDVVARVESDAAVRPGLVVDAQRERCMRLVGDGHALG